MNNPNTAGVPIIKLLHPDAKIPKYAHDGDAGMDIVSLETKSLRPNEVYVFKVGFSLWLPAIMEAQVRTRSGNSIKGLVVANAPGTIDPGFEGEVGVIIRNVSDIAIVVEKGTKIAQMVFCPFFKVRLQEGETAQGSKRGTGGFGSTDTKQTKYDDMEYCPC
jgi:dUTP pyrophosphatase